MSYIESLEIPRGSWCGRLRQNSEQFVVVHGCDVETTNRSFHEGVWSGDFAEHAIAEAVMMSGSGACVMEHGILFVTPSHFCERIYTARRGATFYASNSLVFLLAALGEKPDLTEPDYHFQFLESHRRSQAVEYVDLRTNSGDSIQIRTDANFMVGSDLQVRTIPKPAPPIPKTFEIYHKSIQETLGTLLANAIDAKRKRSYCPISTVSSGYDSAAVATLAVSLGFVDAICFVSEQEDGRPIAKRLGMNIMSIDKEKQGIPRTENSEFFVLGMGHAANYGPLESLIAGRLMLTGYYGGYIWDPECEVFRGSEMPSIAITEGTSLIEFRLRVGFCLLPVPAFGIKHAATIQALSKSEAMRPWRTRPKKYSRPIPRRIVESAGVPRELFGQSKLATGHFRPGEALGPGLKREFESFCKQIPIDLDAQQRSWMRRGKSLAIKLLYSASRVVPRGCHDFHRGMQRLRFGRLTHWGQFRRRLYLYHWALERNLTTYQSGADLLSK